MAKDFDLVDFLPYRINSLAEKMSASLATVYASRFAISVAQWRILATLAAFPGAGATFVAEHCNLDKVKVSRSVVDLESRKLLRRRRHAMDARASKLNLTVSGERLFAQIAPLALLWEDGFLAGLSAVERAQLRKLLGKLEVGVASAKIDSSGLSLSGVHVL